ncbi:MAG: hypothetical protein HYZ53_31175 [Planctomycetes bacterium]|nr:hypothetical protein [Planctomycetota bacterium]
MGAAWKLPAIAIAAGLMVYLVLQDSFEYRRRKRDEPDDGRDRSGQQIRQRAGGAPTRTAGASKPLPAGARRPSSETPTPSGPGPEAATPAPVTLEAGNGKLFVHVVWEDDGTPVAGARVQGALKGFGARKAEAAPSLEAYVLAPCPVGSWRIHASLPGGSEVETTVDVASASAESETRVALPRPGVGSVAVTFAAPPPMPLTAVLERKGGAPARWHSLPGAGGPDRLEVGGLPAGEYALFLTSATEGSPSDSRFQYQQDLPVLVGGGLTTVEAPGGGTGSVTAQIPGAEGEAPFAGWARLMTKSTSGLQVWQVRAGQGRAHFHGIPAGPAVVALSLAENVEPLATMAVEVPAQGEASPVFAMAASGGLRVEVAEMGTGGRIDCVEIALARTDGARIWVGQSERGAAVAVAGLPPDAYVLEASAPGFRQERQTVQVAAGAVPEVHLALTRE